MCVDEQGMTVNVHTRALRVTGDSTPFGEHNGSIAYDMHKAPTRLLVVSVYVVR